MEKSDRDLVKFIAKLHEQTEANAAQLVVMQETICSVLKTIRSYLGEQAAATTSADVQMRVQHRLTPPPAGPTPPLSEGQRVVALQLLDAFLERLR